MRCRTSVRWEVCAIHRPRARGIPRPRVRHPPATGARPAGRRSASPLSICRMERRVGKGSGPISLLATLIHGDTRCASCSMSPFASLPFRQRRRRIWLKRAWARRAVLLRHRRPDPAPSFVLERTSSDRETGRSVRRQVGKPVVLQGKDELETAGLARYSASISAAIRANRRRSSGCIVSMSMMSAQSSPCPSR